MIAIIQTGSKQELLEELETLNEQALTVYINARPSIDIVSLIISKAPNVKEILCPPSLLKQTSSKVQKFLQSAGIRLSHKDIRVGRPKKYADDTVQTILAKKSTGMSVKDIANEMQIPLRTVYYYLKKAEKAPATA